MDRSFQSKRGHSKTQCLQTKKPLHPLQFLVFKSIFLSVKLSEGTWSIDENKLNILAFDIFKLLVTSMTVRSIVTTKNRFYFWFCANWTRTERRSILFNTTIEFLSGEPLLSIQYKKSKSVIFFSFWLRAPLRNCKRKISALLLRVFQVEVETHCLLILIDISYALRN